MQFSEGQDVRLKNTALKALSFDGLLEGSTILLQYSAITCTPYESFPLGELKYAISAG